MAKTRYRYNQVLYGNVTKTQEKIINQRAERLACSQQVTTKMQGTHKTPSV